MASAMQREEPEGDRASELEQLGEELSRRGIHGMRTVLAPDRDDEPVLDVIRSRPAGVGLSVGGMRVRWQDGSFWWSWPAAGAEQIAGDGDVGGAADSIISALQWSRQALNLPAPHLEPGGT